MELIVPLQTMNQAVQPGHQHLAADPLHPMHAAKKTDHRHAGGGAAHFDHPHRQGQLTHGHLMNRGHPQMAFTMTNQGIQMQKLGQMALQQVEGVFHRRGRGQAKRITQGNDGR